MIQTQLSVEMYFVGTTGYQFSDEEPFTNSGITCTA